MKHLITLILMSAMGSLLGVDVLAQEGIIIGSYTDDGLYWISGDFGIERWEKGLGRPGRRELWRLNSSFPGSYPSRHASVDNRFNTSCSLERTLIYGTSSLNKGAIIAVFNNYIGDGTLKLKNVDWPKGILEFRLIFTAYAFSDVSIRMEYAHNSILMKSFKAIGQTKGFQDSIYVIEYKIPEYSYTLDVPIEIKGFKNEK